MTILNTIIKALNTKITFYILAIINIIVSLVIFTISYKIPFQDGQSYWLMGESILHGKFSSWYFLPHYYPETLRTPGYPLFLSFCQLITKSPLFVKTSQLILYFLSIYLCTRIIKKINPAFIYINLFLLFLIPNVQVVFYSGYISTEIVTVFFVVCSMYLLMLDRSLLNAILLGASCYGAFIVRPSFLLFPFILFLYFLYQYRKDFKFSAFFISVYVLLLIPFGLWNKANHGKFKVTSLEGGAGAAHYGFWQLKLPDGYTEQYYWKNNVGFDLTKPNFYSKTEEKENVRLFESEWNNLLKKSNLYLSKADSSWLDYMNKNNPGIFLLYNSKFTMERENLLWQLTIENIINDPFYFIKSRLYHLMRFYVSGVNYDNLNNATSFMGKIKIIFPFIVTLTFIFGGLIFITLCAIFKKIHFQNIFAFLMLFWYYGIMHLPFVIQARYTIPVHLLILSILAVAILKVLKVNKV